MLEFVVPAMKLLKFTSKKSDTSYGRDMKKFFLNGILIATHEVGLDAYCTVKNGVRSRLRDKYKKTHWFRWEHSTLREILGDKYKADDFRVEGHDTRWGFTGGYHTQKSIKDLLTPLFNR